MPHQLRPNLPAGLPSRLGFLLLACVPVNAVAQAFKLHLNLVLTMINQLQSELISPADMSCRSYYLLLRLLFFLSPLVIPSLGSRTGNTREAIEIGIGIGIGGGGGGSSVLPPAPQPLQPSDFENMLQYRAYIVIQNFKNTITCDPQNKTASWVGPRICNNDHCGYSGFYCEAPPDKPGMRTIASVDFNGFKLTAPTVFGFIDNLPDLAIFHANSNFFAGKFPLITGLNFFYEIDFSNNLLSGPFPPAVLCRQDLGFVDLRFNGFVGVLPNGVFNIQTDVLFLNNNKFNGCIPPNLGSTPAIFITLAFNDFTGSIPSSIGQASETLQEILFLGNRLSGCLPYQIGLLKKATVFDAGSNQLTGPIPRSFGCLLKVEELNLAFNQLSGEVPDEVCQLAKHGALSNLSLSGNYFTSIGWSCKDLIQWKVLDVKKNCIPGLPYQRSAEECAWFLKQHKPICPNANYIPCHSVWKEVDPAETSAVAGTRKRSPASGYTTYGALRHKEKP